MTNCKKCGHTKWNHWHNGKINKCTHCNCENFEGNINKVNMTIRRQIEEKYKIIRKDKIRESIKDSPWC